jgi:hypothetical protein
MSLTLQEAELFERWSLHRGKIVPDGLVDETAYTTSKPKILILLKEANAGEDEGLDIREFLRQGSTGATWNTVARWVSAIRQLPSDIRWDDIREQTEGSRTSALRTIATMNVKKYPGGGVANTESVLAIAREDRDFLAEQFRIYDPELVICCGHPTTGCLDEILAPTPHVKWLSTTRGVEYREFGARGIAISYWHPQQRLVLRNFLHYMLLDAVREIMKS